MYRVPAVVFFGRLLFQQCVTFSYVYRLEDAEGGLAAMGQLLVPHILKYIQLNRLHLEHINRLTIDWVSDRVLIQCFGNFRIPCRKTRFSVDEQNGRKLITLLVEQVL
jgi:hypothetical protein